MADYKSFPMEFAQGILSLRSTLATKSAELREMQDDRRVKEEIELGKLGLEEQQINQQGAIASADRMSREAIAKRQGDIEMARYEAQVAQRQDDLKLHREAAKNVALSKWGKSPVYLEPEVAGGLPPDKFNDPTVSIHRDDYGGYWAMPSESVQSATLGKLEAQRDSMAQDTFLKQQRQKTLQAEEEERLARIEKMDNMGESSRATALAGANSFLKTVAAKAAILGGEGATPEEKSQAERLMQDPLSYFGDTQEARSSSGYQSAKAALEVRDAINNGVLEQLKNWKARGKQGPPPLSGQYSPIILDHFAQQRQLLAPIVKQATKDTESTGLTQGYPQSGYYDPTTQTFTPGKQVGGPKGGRAFRLGYTDQSGRETGYEIYTDQSGIPIRSEGTTHATALMPQPPASSGPPAPPGPPAPATDAGAVLPVPNELEQIRQKLKTATPDEKVQLQARLKQILSGGQ